MTIRKKLFVSLSLAQAVCLALGLWMRTQLVDSIGMPGRTPSTETGVVAEIMAFVWIAGLQAGVTWLVLKRVSLLKKLADAEQAAQAEHRGRTSYSDGASVDPRGTSEFDAPIDAHEVACDSWEDLPRRWQDAPLIFQFNSGECPCDA